MSNRAQFYGWPLIGILAAGILLSLAKAIRVFLLNPRELGTPRGAAEDWLLLVAVLVAMCWASLRNASVATVGQAGIVVFSIGLAAIFFQDSVEIVKGIAPRYVESGQSAMEKTAPEHIAMGAICLLTGIGIYRWKTWGRISALVVCIVMLLGTVGYAWGEGFSGKAVLAFLVLASVILWLYHPDVRHRFAASRLP